MSLIGFILRRDPLYHKLAYSKTLRGDFAGAAFGVIVGVFCGYLTLASVGGSSVELSDLTCLCAYASMLSVS